MGESFSERELSVPADMYRLREIRDLVAAAAAEFGLGERDAYALKLATSEAAANAVEHGSTGAADVVRVRVRDEEGALVVYVEDSGRFVPRVKRASDLPERGRGFAFMDELVDEVHLQPGSTGTVVRLAKRP